MQVWALLLLQQHFRITVCFAFDIACSVDGASRFSAFGFQESRLEHRVLDRWGILQDFVALCTLRAITPTPGVDSRSSGHIVSLTLMG